MKTLSETSALKKALEIKAVHRERVRDGYEVNAKDCLTCETKGACCLDTHFVNVRVSRLEALLMAEELKSLPDERLAKVVERVEESIERFGLGDGSTGKTYACPLFEKEVGCLVHDVKPIPCVQHACYEKKDDLPPDSLMEEAELQLDQLAERTYGTSLPSTPIPVAILSLITRD